jgi:hypothetical protein
MPTVPQTPAQHHYAEAERVLDVLASLGATEAEATREAIVAATHALLAVAAAVIGRNC